MPYGIDYDDEAELYPSRTGALKRHGLRYRRFGSAAEAVRFAVEELPPDILRGTYLEVGDARFDAEGIMSLYLDEAYPLARETHGGSHERRRHGEQ